MDERKKVLELVASGQLTVDEGDRLIEALGRTETSSECDPSQLESVIADAISGEILGRTRAARRMSSRGIDEIVTFASLGIDADYVREMRDVLGKVDLQELIQLHPLGIEADYVREMRDVLGDIDIDDLMRMFPLGIEADYVREMHDVLGDVGVDDLMRMFPLGIEADYVRELIDAGLKNLDVDDVIRRSVSGE